MEPQSTSATPSKRQDYVQYTPQIVTNYNQQFDQRGGLGSPTQEHFEDSMLELKDVDTLPSNYAFISQNQPQQQQSIPVVMMPPHHLMHQPPQQMYIPAESQQRVYETPTNNNYIHHHSGMVMNPNVPNMSSSVEPSYDTRKYTTWTRVVLIFAVLLGIYGCFGLVSQAVMIFSSLNYGNAAQSVPAIISGLLLSIIEIAAGAVGVWSTITKNVRHRKFTTIAHLTLLSITIIANIVMGIIVNFQALNPAYNEQIISTGVNPQNLTLILILSVLLYALIIFACCGSCIGCQAYRFRIMSKLQDTQPEQQQGEGFMVMRDEV